MTKQAIKNIVGTTCEVRITKLDSGNTFVIINFPTAYGRAAYTREVATAIEKLHAAGFPEAERGTYSNSVEMVLN